MNDYVVYILLCSDNSYYTGITSKLGHRLYQHEQGIFPTCYTYKRRPVELVYTAHFNDVRSAIRFEKQVKGWSRKKKEALIRGDYEKLHDFSSCSNETHHRNKPPLMSSRAETRDAKEARSASSPLSVTCLCPDEEKCHPSTSSG